MFSFSDCLANVIVFNPVLGKKINLYFFGYVQKLMDGLMAGCRYRLIDDWIDIYIDKSKAYLTN